MASFSTHIPNSDHWITYYGKQNNTEVTTSNTRDVDIKKGKQTPVNTSLNESDNAIISVEEKQYKAEITNNNMSDVQLVSPVASVVQQARAIKRRRGKGLKKSKRRGGSRGRNKKRKGGKKRTRVASRKRKKNKSGKKHKKRKQRDIFNIKIK
jgi:hypothetical protein